MLPSAVIEQLQSVLRNPISPPPRSSAPMRRNMENPRTVLSGLPDFLTTLATASAEGRMLSSSPIAAPPPPQRSSAPRVSLSGAFSLDALNANPLFGGMLPPFSPRVGESISQCRPRARHQVAESGGRASASFMVRDPVSEDEYSE